MEDYLNFCHDPFRVILFDCFPDPIMLSRDDIDIFGIDVLVPTDHVKIEREKVVLSPEEQALKDASNRAKALKRAKQNIYYLCRSNVFDYFLTVTFDDSLHDGYDYDSCVRALGCYLKTWKRKNPDMAYLAIPEHHKSGRWHFHVLVKDCDFSSDLVHATNNNPKSKYYGDLLYVDYKTKDKPIYNLASCTRLLGFNTLIKCDSNSGRLASYIVKYITKDFFDDGSCLKNKRKYTCSQNLKRPEVSDYFIDPRDFYSEVRQHGKVMCHSVSTFTSESFSQMVVYLQMQQMEEYLENFRVYEIDAMLKNRERKDKAFIDSVDATFNAPIDDNIVPCTSIEYQEIPDKDEHERTFSLILRTLCNEKAKGGAILQRLDKSYVDAMIEYSSCRGKVSSLFDIDAICRKIRFYENYYRKKYFYMFA